MKFLKYFENINPFEEEDWDFDDEEIDEKWDIVDFNYKNCKKLISRKEQLYIITNYISNNQLELYNKHIYNGTSSYVNLSSDELDDVYNNKRKIMIYGKHRFDEVYYKDLPQKVKDRL